MGIYIPGVPATRQIIAGTNMTGGGALSADVTLNATGGGGGGGNYVLLQTVSASGSAALALTAFDNATYSAYEIIISDIVPVNNDGLFLRVSTNGGVSYDSGANYNQGGQIYGLTTNFQAAFQNAAQTALRILGDIKAASTRGACSKITLFNPGDATNYKTILGQGQRQAGDSNTYMEINGGQWANTAAYNAVELIMGSGNITTGKASLYGIT